MWREEGAVGMWRCGDVAMYRGEVVVGRWRRWRGSGGEVAAVGRWWRWRDGGWEVAGVGRWWLSLAPPRTSQLRKACGCGRGVWLCGGRVAVWLCGGVCGCMAMWLCGYVAVWLCGCVAV